jgi:hypothetical protein
MADDMKWILAALTSLIATWPMPTVPTDSPLDWAIATYEQADITIPPVQMTIGGEWCEGIVSAYYTEGQIVVCQPDSPRLPSVLLHELGHLLDHTYLTDADRDALMAMWGSESWGSREVTWGDRGQEQFADAIAWVVGAEDTRTRVGVEAEWEVVRVGLNAAEMTAAFEVLLAAIP